MTTTTRPASIAEAAFLAGQNTSARMPIVGPLGAHPSYTLDAMTALAINARKDAKVGRQHQDGWMHEFFNGFADEAATRGPKFVLKHGIKYVQCFLDREGPSPWTVTFLDPAINARRLTGVADLHSTILALQANDWWPEGERPEYSAEDAF